MLELTHRSDGPGIPEDQAKLALQRGHRLDETKPGTGLGLAIVSELVAEYGGELLLDPSANRRPARAGKAEQAQDEREKDCRSQRVFGQKFRPPTASIVEGKLQNNGRLDMHAVRRGFAGFGLPCGQRVALSGLACHMQSG